MKEYNEIKKNIIEKFLVPYYKYTCIKLKNTIIYDISKRSIFPISYDNDNLIFELGDGINIVIKIVFEETINKDFRIVDFI